MELTVWANNEGYGIEGSDRELNDLKMAIDRATHTHELETGDRVRISVISSDREDYKPSSEHNQLIDSKNIATAEGFALATFRQTCQEYSKMTTIFSGERSLGTKSGQLTPEEFLEDAHSTLGTLQGVHSKILGLAIAMRLCSGIISILELVQKNNSGSAMIASETAQEMHSMAIDIQRLSVAKGGQ